ncbi:hypothetical protein [Nocardioides cavernaquae]|uniref:Uncharacterized protein n=1 Tax=Nocardioides cavernaquae TaxID=2321396 RepID=A0A3A5HI46_9ACTN|nr:hypothetical protein [Nocardioides cavernaquae]RJS47377.1 hypothetical protein D4739_14900 [Nocardioides cavernaquae]
MNPTLLLALVLVVLVTLAGVLAALLLKERARSREALARTRSEAAELRARVDALAAHAAAQDRARREPEEFVITHLGEPEPEDYVGPTATRIDGKLFADLVLRESLVKAAALTHGVRRALAPETRNRIRFEMKREVKRAKRSRKDEFRQVRDEMRARARAAR